MNNAIRRNLVGTSTAFVLSLIFASAILNAPAAPLSDPRQIISPVPATPPTATPTPPAPIRATNQSTWYYNASVAAGANVSVLVPSWVVQVESHNWQADALVCLWNGPVAVRCQTLSFVEGTAFYPAGNATMTFQAFDYPAYVANVGLI